MKCLTSCLAVVVAVLFLHIVSSTPCFETKFNAILPSVTIHTKTIGSFNDALAVTIDNVLEPLKGINESLNPQLISVSAALYEIVNSARELTGTADDIAISLANSLDKNFTLINDIVTNLSDLLEDLPETVNIFILNIRDSLNAIFSATASGCGISIDKAFVNVLISLLKFIDCIDTITNISSAVSDEINDEIATEIAALSLILPTVLCISEIILVVSAEGNDSTTVTLVIDSVMSTIDISVTILNAILNNATDLTASLAQLTILLNTATLNVIAEAGPIINVKYVATGIISGLSASFSTIVGQITSSIDVISGGIISGMCSITAGIGGALGDLVNAAAKAWGISKSLGNIIDEFSGIVDTSASSVGDMNGMINCIASESEGSLQVVSEKIYEAVDMIGYLGTSFVVADIISLIKSTFDCIEESIASIADDIGNDLTNIIRDTLSRVNIALCRITTIVGGITPANSVSIELDGATVELASAIVALAGTITLITEQTGLALTNLKNAEDLGNAIAALSLVLSVVYLLAQGVLFLISGALVIVTGHINTSVHALTSSVVAAVQRVLETIGIIITSSDGGICASFTEIITSLTDVTNTIGSGVSSIIKGVKCVSDTLGETIFNSLSGITES